MEKKNIAIIFGGRSNEYEVSLQSAAAVVENIDRNNYSPVLVGITKEGTWLEFQGDCELIRNDTWHSHDSCVSAFLSPSRGKSRLVRINEGKYSSVPIDVVFPVLHGKNGEDGTIQGLLELAGIPFVGCDTLSSAICMDKAVAHSLVETAGIKVPRSVVLYKGEKDAKAIVVSAELQFPLYVKPAKSGSSIGITKVFDLHEVNAAVDSALLQDNKIIIEEAVEGFEVGCAILGNEHPIVGEVDEIELTGDFFDFNEKYTLATSRIHMPARVDKATSDRIKETALHIYKVLCCKGMARVDMFLTPQKEIVFNEVNTIPGFTDKSRYPKMLSAVGLSYSEIIDRLIRLALAEEKSVE